MQDSAAGASSHVLGLVLLVAALLAAVAVAFFWAKGRKIPGSHVFRASRFSRGNLLFPTQVSVTPTSVVHFTPRFVGGYEHSMHIAHVASVAIEQNLVFSNVLIESSGGTSPVSCHGHHKRDAVEMKRLIEEYQTQYYRGQGPEPPARKTAGP